jgi:hypothetical protein
MGKPDGKTKKIESKPATEGWPFGDDPRPMEGYLRALNPRRDELIGHTVYGISTYPQTGQRGRVYIYDAVRKTCSGDECKEGCVHSWEDAFRFGQYKGRRFVPPAERVRIGERPKNDPTEAYGAARRVRKRPNPTIDGKKFATIMQTARIAMPMECKSILLEVFSKVANDEEERARRERVRSGEPEPKTGRGRPAVSLADRAFAAIVRFEDQLSYEALEKTITDLQRAGFVSREFSYKRVVEAMTDPQHKMDNFLGLVIETLKRPFRNITKCLVLDGMAFSTARTDNSRKKRFTKNGPIQMSASMLYEIRFGFVAAFRVTWLMRGRGSNETMQFEYLVTKAREIFDFEYVLADAAYHSARNERVAKRLGFKLISEPKHPYSYGKDKEQGIDEALRNQAYRFRNRVEGWNDVTRETVEPYMVSRPDRKKYPAQTQKELIAAEKLKTEPNLAELMLPEDQNERERIINDEQFVGYTPNIEMRIRQIIGLLRATVKAQKYYSTTINFKMDRAFSPRPEDEEFSIFRPAPQNGLETT